MTYIKTFSSPVGALTVKSDGVAVTEIIFGDLAGRDDLPILNEAEKQLGEYFCGTRRDFDLPIVISGTAFQVKVWAALRKYRTAKRFLIKRWPKWWETKRLAVRWEWLTTKIKSL